MPSPQDRAKWAARREFEKVLKTLRPGEIAIDCGANIGKFTAPMANTGATVFAFEPDPEAFVRLRERLGNFENVTLIDKAVGGTNGLVRLYRAVDFAEDPCKRTVASSIFASKQNVDDAAAVTVEQIELAAFIAALDKPVALLKLDIEGAEVPVIEHLLETRTIDGVRNLFVETHEKRIPELASRTALLREQLVKRGGINANFNWR
jgi:FkbM family methyltransferase